MANEETKEERQMLPEVKAYTEAREAAIAAFNKAIKGAETKCPMRNDWNAEDSRAQRQAFREAQDAAYDARSVAFDTAWGALKRSGDPLVKWIAENAEDYIGEALIVLQTLPATLDELDELAERQDWCGTWTSLRERAIEAGVMPGAEPPSEAYKAVFQEIDNVSCCNLDARGKRRVGKALDALLASVKSEEAVAA